MSKGNKGFLLGLGVSLVVLLSALGGALADRLFVIKPLDRITGQEREAIVNEEIRVVD